MKVLELFSGTESISKAFRKEGHQTITIDNNKDFNPRVCVDILNYPIGIFRQGIYKVVWASPPCQTFSVASISTHWKGGHRAYQPKTKECVNGLKLLDKTIQIISITNPKYWFIENPRGVMRKVIDKIFKKYGIKDYTRYTLTYCQYGDGRMKPTDIWTNVKGWQPKKCKNGMPCHVSAPRGSKTGTQGLKNSIERSRIPTKLCNEIRSY